MDKWIKTDKLTGRQADRKIDKLMKPDKLTGKQTGRQTDRQTDRMKNQDKGLTKYFHCGHITTFPVDLTTDRPQEFSAGLFSTFL